MGVSNSVQLPVEDPLILHLQSFTKINNNRYRYIHSTLPKSPTTLVFIPGFGGQISQYSNLITHFQKSANILSMDLLGFGLSDKPKADVCYKTDSVARDVFELVGRVCEGDVVVVGHSYGCTISVKVYNLLVKAGWGGRVRGVVLIAPKAFSGVGEEWKKWVIVNFVPGFLLTFLRFVERIGGPYSTSVNRIVSPDCTLAVRQMQLHINSMVENHVIFSMLKTMTFATQQEYESITCPVLVIGAELDQVCKVDPHCHLVKQWSLKRSLECILKVFPRTGHNLIYDSSSLCNAFIYDFLVNTCKLESISIEKQLIHERNDPKWNLKNFEKWTRTPPISTLTKFRPMKTLREHDLLHSPQTIPNQIHLLIDISKDLPPYNPASLPPLTKYYKLPTVSKTPPTPAQVDEFVRVCDGFWSEDVDGLIAVHCHYGFNRTGFLICCYLITRLGMDVQSAMDVFSEARKPGIRHLHFKDELFLRYGLQSLPKNKNI